MYKEYKWPKSKAQEAISKKVSMEKEFGYRFPLYQVKSPKGEEFISLFYPVGLQPNKRRRK